MSSPFMSLPRELRQRILLLALPQDVQPAVVPYFSLPVQNLLHISRTVRQEMPWVLNNYSPRFYLRSPSHLADFLSFLSKYRGVLSFEYKPKFEHVSLNIFHDAEVDTMQWTCYCRGRDMHTHDELVNAWVVAVPTIPEQVKTILLDITPAPGPMREDRPEWVPGFIQDNRISKRFVTEHEAVLMHLVQCTQQQFGNGVSIQLSGQLSEKSRSSLDNVVARSAVAGIDIRFVGDMLAVQPRIPRPQIWKAVQKLAPVRYRWIEEENRSVYVPPRNEQERQLAGMHSIHWSVDTQKLWTRIANQDEAWAIALLLKFGQFMTSGDLDRVDFSPMDSRQRALVHNMAKDLNFNSQAVGEEPERFVRIEKYTRNE
ncbi:uncharacterized protein BDZ99DRAFT_569407 [Mytilinidion resinicola]|uniref:R3H domain-containing protein n=1 Tax=Mytilinidion resinicola TaxID=574789 RepID=A0A6A6YQZ5_9PEZI|nr:uncharacterized protein BDZ99DRAFT_569407 [Mytilinidion resinicola]KAF2811332.1 hypothetical protein BDZ99DRAFT_569407 [Mytilinidion resinicola]